MNDFFLVDEDGNMPVASMAPVLIIVLCILGLWEIAKHILKMLSNFIIRRKVRMVNDFKSE